MAEMQSADVFNALGLIKETDITTIGPVFSRLPQGRLSDELVQQWIGLNSTDDIFILAHRMDHDAPPHAHAFYELSYIFDGVVINAVDGQRLYMPPETLCVMNLNSVHALEVVNPQAVVVNLCIRKSLFEKDLFHDFLESDNIMARFLRGETGKGHLFFSDSGNHMLANTMVGIAQEFARAGNRQSFALAGRVLVLLDELAKTPGYSFFGMDSNAMRMITYIRDHCDTVTIKDIAKEFGYSQNYCTQYIKKHTGYSATQLIADARMSRAEVLLRTTDMSVHAVAETVGYRSLGHFNELFRSYHDMTPGDYRKLCRFAL